MVMMNPYGNWYGASGSLTTNYTPWYPNTTMQTFEIQQTPQPDPVLQARKEADEGALEWLDRRVDEICQLVAA